MSFSRPTLSTIISRIRSDIETSLPGADAHVRKTVEYVLARALAEGMHSVYGYVDTVYGRIFPDTAQGKFFWRLAGIYGVEQKAPTAFEGVHQFTGTDGSTIAAGTTLQDSDGNEFTTNVSAEIASGSVDVAITAVEVGSQSNVEAGQTLTLTSPVTGVDADGTLQSVTRTGTDQETEEQGLQRLLQRLREPPKGGGKGDYETWALEVSGVTRAWEYPKRNGPGTVAVAFVRDDEDPIVPSASERDTVLMYIEERRPVTAEVSIVELSENAINFTFSALTPNTVEVRDAIKAELKDLFAREAKPGGTIELSKIVGAISVAAGEDSHVLTSPSSDVTVAAGEIAVVGTLSFP